MKKLWTAAGILVLCAGLGWGVPYMWTGSYDGDWLNEGNWTIGGATGTDGNPLSAPGTLDDVVIDTATYSGASLSPTANIPASLTVASLTVDDSAVNLSMTITVSAAVILRAGTITLTGNSTAGTVTISGGTLALGSYGLTATGTISNTGTITAGGGALESSGGSVSGTGVISGTSLVVSAAIGIDLSGANTIDSVSLINTTSGPIVYNGEVSGGLTAAANNGGTGAITIRNTGGDLTVGSGGISGGGAVNISTATSGGIVINDGIDGSTVNVSAAGGISGTGGIAAGTTVSLTANSGSVSEGGVVSGTSLTVNAAAGISLGGANTIGSVSLINTTNGSIVYNGAVSGGLTATGGNTGGGSIAITNTGGNLTVGTGGISGGGAVTLSTPDNYNISIGGAISGIERLALKAGTSASSTGNVAISAAVSVTGSGAGHIEAASAVYVWAHDMTGGGGITPGTGQACLWVDQHPSYSGAVAGGRVHIHPRNGGHVVYRNGVDAPAAHGVSPPYFYIDSSSAALPTTLVYHLAAGNNAYIIDVGTRNRAVTFTCSGTGFIEIRGAYQSNAALTLTPGTGGVRLANSDATPADPGVVNLTASAFTLPAGTNLELRGGTGTPASITAADITLGGGITGTASEANNLVLNAGIGALSVTGAVGSTGTKLGDISVAAGTGGAVSFSSTINAKSYTQTGAGSATFGAAQNYTKAFSFTGTNLTVNSSLRTDSDSTNDDGPFSFTGAGFALNGALTTGSGSIGAANTVTINNTGAFTTSAGTGAISAGGAFSQTGTTGTVSIGAGITTRNSTDTDAAISFADAVSIAPANNGTVTFNSNAGNGPITLSGAVNSAGTNRSLTLNSGAGIVTLSNTVSLTGSFTKSGAGRTILNNNITSNSANSGNNYGISFAGDIELGRNITLSTGTGGGNITISGLVDGYTSSTRRNLTLTAGTGTISVTGVVGHDGATESSTIRLGILKVTSAANVSFGGAVWAVSFDQSNAAGTGSGGSGLTAFNGAQDYTGGFKFIGTNLTVNNTLATDTDTSGGDGDIAVTVSGSPGFTVGAPNGSILPGVSGAGGSGLLTVTGSTVNNGTITAGNITSGTPVVVNGVNYYKVIDFNGNYTSTGNLNGASSTTDNQLVIFRGDAAFGNFAHNGDTLQFSGTTHTVSKTGGVTFAGVVIDAGNTVTVASGTTVAQDPAGAGSTLILNGILNTTAGTWYIGPPTTLPSLWYMLSNPSTSSTGDSNYSLHTGANPAPAFTTGFAGFNGVLTMGSGAALNTKDFYTQMTNASPPNTFTLTAPSAAPNCTISASGNVTINETFGDFTHSTLTMTGNGGKLAVRGHQPPSGPPSPLWDWEVDVQLGDFVANAGSNTGTATVINSTVVFAGENAVTIRANRWLKVYPGAYIRVDPEAGLGGSKWKQETGAVFDLSTQPVVEFGTPTSSPAGRTFVIEGNTIWYDLICREPRATLQFSNYPDAHSVSHKLFIEPRSDIRDSAPPLGTGELLVDENHENMILLTRLTDMGLTPPVTPDAWIPPTSLATPYDVHFWRFKLESTAEMYMNYVFLNYSYAVNRIPLPMAGSTVIVATPYVYLSSPPPPPPPPSDYTLGNPRSDVGGSGPEFPATVTDRSYYNINWLVSDRFFYGFTEDWDHNGKIDRIRIQAGFRVTGSAEASFSNNKFVVVVEGYEVTRYARADEDTNTPPLNSDAEGRMQDMIYVYVKEKDYTDTGARPVWWVARNEGVFDLSTKTIPLQLPEKEKMEAWDNVPPWINYALTVPKAKFTRAGYTDKGEIFVQFSESVHAPSLGPITLSSGSIDLSGIWDLDSRGREFIIPLMAPYSLGDLAAIPPTFTLTKLQDNADYARDRRSSGAIYAYQYPSPKYPIDWDYKDYVEVQGDPLNLWNRPSAVGINFTVVNPSGGTLPETVPKKDAVSLSLGADTGNKGVGIFPLLSHRVTDLLVSVPPTTVGDTQYFVWPLWAKYKTLDPEDYDGTLGGVPGPGYGYMNSGGAFSDTTVIWDFTGKRFLERSDDVLLQARVNTGVPAPAMAAVSNVPDSYKASAVHGPQGLWLPSASPSFRNMVPDFYPMGTSSMTPAGTGLYNYTFPKTTYGAGNSAVEFFFHLSGSPADLFAGRLHIAPGEAVPSNWYRLVRPFSFGLHNITRQRGGVTILNNVINSEKRENVFLDYKLEKSGRVTVQVFTLDGNLVKVLVRENQGAKDTYYRAAWDGTNKGGRAVARGMYFIRIVAPDIDEIRKVMVVK